MTDASIRVEPVAGAFGFVQHGGDVFAGADVVGQGDRARPASLAVPHSDVLDEPGTGVVSKPHSVERKAHDGLGVLLARDAPAERLVERACTR